MDQGEKPKEEILNDLFPSDMDQILLRRRNGAKNLTPNESDFLAKFPVDENLSEKYVWQVFLRDVSEYITRNYESIVSQPIRRQRRIGPKIQTPNQEHASNPVLQVALYRQNQDPDGTRPDHMSHIQHIAQMQQMGHIQDLHDSADDVTAMTLNGVDTNIFTVDSNLHLNLSPTEHTLSTQQLYEQARQAARPSPSRRGKPTQRRPWSKEEEQALFAGLDQVKGPHWSQILTLYGAGGTISEALKDRNQVQLKDKASCFFKDFGCINMDINNKEELISNEEMERDNHFDISEEDLEKINTLLDKLMKQPFDYDSHIEYINLFKKHKMKDELKSAREAMQLYFPLTEKMWIEWLDDQEDSASTLEDKISLLELYSKSVEDYLSINLWKKYMFYVKKQVEIESNDKNSELGKLFNYEFLKNVYLQAYSTTKYHILQSQEIWSIYRDYEIELLEKNPSYENIQYIKQIYIERLSIPHFGMEKCFSDFSCFITNYDNSNYEEIMIAANKIYNPSLIKYQARDFYEIQLSQSNYSYEQFIKYLEWELHQKPQELELICTLFERLLTCYPLAANIWEDYIQFMFEKSTFIKIDEKFLQRSVKNYPWSGILWKHYIYMLEHNNSSLEEICTIKDRSISSGTLFHDINELAKVLEAWCGYCKRRVTIWDNDNEEVQYVITQLRTSIKLLKNVFKTTDKQQRLEKMLIYITTKLGNIDEARKIWKNILKIHVTETKYWLQYFIWERNYGEINNAINILKNASLKHLDFPELIFDIYRDFVIEEGSLESLEKAETIIHKGVKNIQLIKEKESINLKTKNNQQFDESKIDLEEIPNYDSKSKKKSKNEDKNRRNRENTTVRVTGLPKSVSVEQLYSFFYGCGDIINTKIIEESSDNSSTAFVEFANIDDTKSALTKNYKKLDENEILVEPATETTLWVTNFPPSADEKFVHKLFEKYGDVIEVRFPSLRYNSRRRFCYVQMKYPEQALASLSLHGQIFEKKYKLIVNISDSSKKESRKEATSEGREIIVSNISPESTEDDLIDLFSKYGTLESIRLIYDKKSKFHKGFCYIIFSTTEQALSALDANKKELNSAILSVEIVKVRNKNIFEKNKENYKDTFSCKNTDFKEKDKHNLQFHELKSNSLGILYLPDTVNQTRIKNVFEAYGDIDKIELRPDHQGAIVQYKHPSDAGKAAMALDGYAFSNKKIRIVTVETLLQHKPQKNALPDQDIIAPKINDPGTRKERLSIPEKSITSRKRIKISDNNNDPMQIETTQRTLNNADFRAILMEKKSFNTKENIVAKRPQSSIRLKIVIRYLPPDLSEQAFQELVKEWIDKERVEWFSFYPGKVSSNRNKNDKYARAYIKFKSPEALITFYKGFNTHVFSSEKGKGQRVLIEFAPFQKIPRPERQKHDARQGTIDDDAEFIAFQETLKNTNKSTQEEEQSKRDDDDMVPIDAITPLIEYLRAQKEAAALKSKQQQKKYTIEKKPSTKTKADAATTQIKLQGNLGFTRKFNKNKNKPQKELDNPDARKESSMRPEELFPRQSSSYKRVHKNPLKKNPLLATNTSVEILKPSNREKSYDSNVFNKEKKYDSSQLLKKTDSTINSTSKTENEVKRNTKKRDYTKQSSNKDSKNNTEHFNKPNTFRGKGNEHFGRNYRNKNIQE
ncbi:hypothetical protein PORY_001512 [Pneumocystis oryctolagi]|uniref:Uncharacterized protein n=1 Tax=Pneumocystis oryctolagi TaxID=42067 RepID=A0ACB7CC64_9ASCO|nr:hypothetical protein PORY_001512 [Pneumocystis oryctolagi]